MNKKLIIKGEARLLKIYKLVSKDNKEVTIYAGEANVIEIGSNTDNLDVLNRGVVAMDIKTTEGFYISDNVDSLHMEFITPDRGIIDIYENFE